MIDFSLYSGMIALAYLNSESFDIMRSDGMDAPPKGWFYADDRLAETIQALNLRGYATCGCRIDPAFDRYTRVTLINVRDSDGKIPAHADIARAYERKMQSVQVTNVKQTGNRRYQLTMRTRAPREIRIQFCRNIQFKSLPGESRYENKALFYTFPAELDGLAYLNECLKCIQALYEWACALPVGLW